MSQRHEGSTDTLTESAEKLLSIIYQCTPDEPLRGRKKMMKLGFLAEYFDTGQNELDTLQRLGTFDFVIYKYGPFSRGLLDAFDELRRKDFLIEEPTSYEHIIQLTEKGREAGPDIFETLNDIEKDQIQHICSEFGNKHGSVLEDESLELLGISKEEKSDYQGQPVDVIITEMEATPS